MAEEEECPVCAENIPVQELWPGGCGHRMCRECMRNIISRGNRLCPMCRRPANEVVPGIVVALPNVPIVEPINRILIFAYEFITLFPKILSILIFATQLAVCLVILFNAYILTVAELRVICSFARASTVHVFDDLVFNGTVVVSNSTMVAVLTDLQNMTLRFCEDGAQRFPLVFR